MPSKSVAKAKANAKLSAKKVAKKSVKDVPKKAEIQEPVVKTPLVLITKPPVESSDNVPVAQIEKAAKALMAFESKKDESSLLESPYYWLILTSKLLPERLQIKPVPVQIPYPLFENPSVCLITKDPQREYKDKLAALGLGDVRVIGISKLRTKFKAFEAKRQLAASYDIFLADERVLPLLPSILGKCFFQKKRHPCPVNLTKNDVKSEITKAMQATFIHRNKGVCTAVKVGKISMTVEQNVENIATAIPLIVDKLPGGWDNIQSISLKTNSSTALPLYTALPNPPSQE